VSYLHQQKKQEEKIMFTVTNNTNINVTDTCNIANNATDINMADNNIFAGTEFVAGEDPLGH
jgi:hypothetical protein